CVACVQGLLIEEALFLPPFVPPRIADKIEVFPGVGGTGQELQALQADRQASSFRTLYARSRACGIFVFPYVTESLNQHHSSLLVLRYCSIWASARLWNNFFVAVALL